MSTVVVKVDTTSDTDQPAFRISSDGTWKTDKGGWILGTVGTWKNVTGSTDNLGSTSLRDTSGAREYVLLRGLEVGGASVNKSGNARVDPTLAPNGTWKVVSVS